MEVSHTSLKDLQIFELIVPILQYDLYINFLKEKNGFNSSISTIVEQLQMYLLLLFIKLRGLFITQVLITSLNYQT